MNSIDILKKELGEDRVKQDFILAPYTTFKMGGKAEYYFEARSEKELIDAVKTAYTCKLKLTFLGGASNIVISSKGLKGLVIRNQVLLKKIEREDKNFVIMRVSSGYSMTRLAKETADDGLSGLEYHVGLPGTVGGALYMNSKWYIKDILGNRREAYVGDSLVRAKLINQKGEEKKVDYDYFQFSYDHSIVQETGDIILWVEFELAKVDPQTTKKTAQISLDYRKQTQPFGVATSGCFFKNVNGQSAGKLIDELGLKGYSIGGATISDKHANFIINTGNATEEDVHTLIAVIKEKVKKKYGVKLQEEVILLV